MAKPTAEMRALTIQDQALDAVRRIETLAALLEAPGHQSVGTATPLDPEVVAEAAGMIGDETARIRAAVEALRRLVPAKKS